MTTTESSTPAVAAAPKAQRVHVSNVSLSFSFLPTEIAVDVLSIKLGSEDSNLVTVCPDCAEAHKLNRMYICGASPDHGPFYEGGKAKEIDGVLHKLTEIEINSARGVTIEKNEATISIFDAASVTSQTRPSDSAYRLRPHGDKKRPASRKAKAAYVTVTQAIAANPDKAFVFELNLKGYQSMYRLEVWNNQLVAQKLIRPDDLQAIDVIDGETNERLIDMMNELIADEVTDFDPAEWQNHQREAHRQLIEAKAGEEGSVAAPKTAKPVEPAFSLDDLMNDLEAARSKKKPAAKKSAAKKEAAAKPAKKAAASKKKAA